MDKAENLNYYHNGDYIISGLPNAFNGRTSYWISKKGYTTAAYCFTADRPAEVDYQLENGWPGYIDLFERHLKRLLSSPEWVSVNDRPPETDGSYIVATKNGGVIMTHFYKGSHGSPGKFSSTRMNSLITHWMERPDPPKPPAPADVSSETNADRIRRMDDEELTDFLTQWATSSRVWQKESGETLGWLREGYGNCQQGTGGDTE